MAKKSSTPDVRVAALSELTPDSNNANRHTERGMQLLEDSIQQCGMGRSILIDKNGRIIAGNATAEKAGSAGIGDVIIVPTDGTKIIAVQRTDLDLQTDPRAKQLAIADNRVGQVNLDWDTDVLGSLSADVNLQAAGITADELAAMGPSPSSAPSDKLDDVWAVYVECRDEADQVEMLQRIKADGRQPRSLISVTKSDPEPDRPIPTDVQTRGRTISLECTVEVTPRFMQLAGIHDLPQTGTTRQEFTVDLDLPAEWNVGAIIGPSGTGKTTIARALFGDRIVRGFDWPADRCIADGFPAAASIVEIQGLLSSVGFSSPRDWLKRFRVLSNGQQFRATLARAMSEMPDLAVIDEFGAYVDQQVRSICAHAVAKAARHLGRRFVAVGTHDDMLDSLDPDWVYFPHTGKLARGRLHRRQSIDLEIIRSTSAAWRLFREHHYLSRDIHKGANCFVALIDGRPVAFASVIHFAHPRRSCWREHRTVCLPDFQGRGIGNAISEYVASLYVATGKRYRSVTSSPAMINHRLRSPLWHCVRAPMMLHQNHDGTIGNAGTGSIGRITATFEYVGPPRRTDAEKFGLIR